MVSECLLKASPTPDNVIFCSFLLPYVLKNKKKSNVHTDYVHTDNSLLQNFFMLLLGDLFLLIVSRLNEVEELGYCITLRVFGRNFLSKFLLGSKSQLVQ